MIMWIYITLNSGLRYFTLKLQKIFKSLQKKIEKLIFVLLFHLTLYVYF
jgi:hypothetical protein